MSLRSLDESAAASAVGIQADAVAHVDEWVTPDSVDEVGYLRTGKLLEWMHVVAVLAASRHCHAPVATVSIDGVRIERALRLGDRVSLTARVAHTSPRSVSVLVEVVVDKRHSLAAYLSFVMINRQGLVQVVPPFAPATPVEAKLYREAELRRVERKRLHALLGGHGGVATHGRLTAGGAPITIDTSTHDLDRLQLTPIRRPDHGLGRRGLRMGEPASGGETDSPDHQAARIAELLKLFPTDMRCPWEATVPGNGHRSYVHSIEIVRKSHLNFLGTLHAGTATRWLERAACLSARAWLGHAPVRLTALQGLTFLNPATEKQFVHMRAMVVHTDPEALTVLVTLHTEDPVANRQVESVRGLLSYVPTGPTPVAKLVCTTEDEILMFQEAARRLALHRALERRAC